MCSLCKAFGHLGTVCSAVRDEWRPKATSAGPKPSDAAADGHLAASILKPCNAKPSDASLRSDSSSPAASIPKSCDAKPSDASLGSDIEVPVGFDGSHTSMPKEKSLNGASTDSLPGDATADGSSLPSEVHVAHGVPVGLQPTGGSS